MVVTETEPVSPVEQVSHADDTQQEEKADDMTIPITPDLLKGWLRRARRKFRHGVQVVKVASGGKLLKRTIYVGAKPEYFEISSAKLYDLAYHLSEIASITTGMESPDFDAFFAGKPEKVPRAEKCCVVKTARTLSFVFKNPSDRRDFMFLLRVELRAVKARYEMITQRFEQRAAATRN